MKSPLIAVLLLSLSPVSRAADDTNIVVVFVDDMGWSDLSCFGGTGTTTEHIDRLAAEGIRFTNFYVNAPICSPSRVALTTGQYPQRWRITSFLNNRRSNTDRRMAQWLDPEAPILARELQHAGYATGHFGKWHMGGQRDVADAPAISQYGFDESLTNFEGMGAKLLPLTMKPGWEQPGRIWEDAVRLGEPVVWMQRSEITRGFVSAAIDFIDGVQRSGKPFYVNLWPDDVHSPYFPPLEEWGDDRRSLYLSVLNAMDEQLAPLFDRIRNDAALRDSTLILFCSDNGPDPRAGSSEPLRGGKGWLYEGGVRSPLIVWGPGLMAAGAVGSTNSEAVLSAIDVNRSLYDIAGISVPAGTTLDGENVAQTLLGHKMQGRTAPIFWRRPPDRPGTQRGEREEDNPDLAARDGKWKYYVNYDGGDPQLYDLEADVAETRNVITDHADVARQLQHAVAGWNAALPGDAGDEQTRED
jgi:arylsulfatase A-like enzyme